MTIRALLWSENIRTNADLAAWCARRGRKGESRYDVLVREFHPNILDVRMPMLHTELMNNTATEQLIAEGKTICEASQKEGALTAEQNDRFREICIRLAEIAACRP